MATPRAFRGGNDFRFGCGLSRSLREPSAIERLLAFTARRFKRGAFEPARQGADAFRERRLAACAVAETMEESAMPHTLAPDQEVTDMSLRLPDEPLMATGSVRVVAAKLHGMRVTQAKLDYHGSITIDTEILERAGMLPLEYVHVWNKNCGARLDTYVLPGERGSGVVCLNGAAARLCQPGDDVIVSAERQIGMQEYRAGFRARVLMFVHEPRVNTVSETLVYEMTPRDGMMRFQLRALGD